MIGRFDKPEDFYYHDAAGNLQGSHPRRQHHSRELNLDRGQHLRGPQRRARSTPKTAHSSATPNPNSPGASATLSTTKGFDLERHVLRRLRQQGPQPHPHAHRRPTPELNILRSSLNFARVAVIDPSLPDNDYRNLQVGQSRIDNTSSPSAHRCQRPNFTHQRPAHRRRILHPSAEHLSFGYTLPRQLVNKLSTSTTFVYISAPRTSTPGPNTRS